jgi:ectoine hydroxylase-related dioxygenase (phytanoyl-CoA dioxygenase family)
MRFSALVLAMPMNSLEPSKPEAASIAETAKKYERDGYCVLHSILPQDLIRRTVDRMDAVMRGEYETGQVPLDSWWSPSDPPTKLRKIDQAHLSDRTIFEAVTYPELGRLVAAITGARLVQIWAVQMLYKPAGGDAKGAVGWHQDLFYWKNWWKPDSNVFTAWLALSDVREECGPMHFAAGSQRWGLLNASDFFGVADDKQRAAIPLPPGETWRDESGAMPAGAFSLHNCLTFHGSQPNVSQIPRYSFAIHLRTEKSSAIPNSALNPTDKHNYDYVGHLDDLAICPVIYRG